MHVKMKPIVCTAKKHKHDEMAFLTSRNVSKRVLLTLGVDHTARDAMKGEIHRG